MMTEPKNPTEEKELVVRRGRVACVDLYEIKDSELLLLEKGSPAGVCFNFAIFLLSIAFTAIASLCTATFGNPKHETLFIIISVVGSLGGLFLLIIWWLMRRSISATVREIRNRIPALEPSASSQTEPPPKG